MSSPEAHVGAHPDAVQGNPNQDGRLHSKIVEILASTTNGCLQELGYHPSMIEKLKQHAQLIKSLQEENSKLYQDNYQLVVAIRVLEERVAHHSASPNSQLQQFSIMQERIRALESERAALTRKNQDILISVNKGTSHHHLVQELDRMRTYTNRVCRDMQILQDRYDMATRHGESSSGALYRPNSVPQIAQPRIPTPSDLHHRRVSTEGAPRLQPSRLPPQQFQQHAQHPRPIRPQVQHTLPPHQLQHAHQTHPQRRVSDHVQNPYPPQQPLHMLQGWKHSPSASAPPMFETRSPTEFAHMPSILSPVNPNRPQQPPFTHPHTLPLQNVYRTASAPLVPFNLHPNSQTTTSRPALFVDLTREDERITEQARGGMPDYPSGLKRTNSVLDDSMEQDIELIKRQRTAEPTQSPEDVIANVNPEPIQSSPDTVVGSNPTSPVSLPAPLQENTDTTSTGQVDVANDEASIAFTPSDTAVGSNPTSPSSVIPSPAQDRIPGPSSGDNLRSVEECVYMIYEADAEVVDGYFCGRCLDRYDMGMIPEQPDVLVIPKFEDLFMHCTQEHPTIWEDLRHRRDLEALAPPPPSS
ncbi:uncharacterized protein EDB93DRAFT_129267 [Suillus bovinus]|uniref:uncharacterized protein n=1 Tax=Suillus bovinus TaxID=48563 RepID=UPI001B872EDA|nr:uncharacterized protein EDB93DRAFT_129267 [Suillus bovinus]KAG2155012.1 hypothetical protein EDB93DRAFT_129267 [Suillus bovinus]